MATYKVNSNGKAPSGLKSGDTVVTGGGTYKITGVNSDGSYKSTKVNNTTTSSYKGSYSNPSSGSTSGSSGGGSSSSSSSKKYDAEVDYSLQGTNQMAQGASWQDVLATYNARQAKALDTPGLGKYVNDDISQQMLDYIINARSQEAQNQYKEEFEFDEEKPTYESQYDPAIQALLEKILNRGDFSYDALNDPLYQQYSAQYQREGDRAMRNTLAEAAASAGGMNSYAITAAQQANDYYASQMADKVPELYQLAYQMYLQDKESMVQDLGLLQGMDNTQYNRYRDTMQDYYNDKNFAYGFYKDAITQGNWEKQFGYNQMVDDRNFNYGASQDVLDREQWNKQWENTLSQQEIQNNRYDTELKREDEQRAKEEAQTQAFALLELGQMPPSALLQAAGIDEAYASAYLAGIKAQLASKSSGDSGGGSKKGGSSYTGKDTGNKTGYTGNESSDSGFTWTGDATKVDGYNDGSLAGLGLGPVDADTIKELVVRGAIEVYDDGTYKWADGWSAQNYMQRLKDFSVSNIIGFKLPGLA